MAKIIGQGTLKAEIVLVLSEEEAGALDALVGYGFTAFRNVFYEKLGKAYMEKYESGLKSLFESVRSGEGSVESPLTRFRDARAVFNGLKIAAPKQESSNGQ